MPSPSRSHTDPEGLDPLVVALPHLEGAQVLLLRALEGEQIDRDLVLRAAAKLADVRELIDPEAGFSLDAGPSHSHTDTRQEFVPWLNALTDEGTYAWQAAYAAALLVDLQRKDEALAQIRKARRLVDVAQILNALDDADV